MRVFDGIEVLVGRKRYRFMTDQVDYYRITDGLLSLSMAGETIMIFNKWDAIRFIYVKAEV